MPVKLKNNARGLLAVSLTSLDTVVRVRVGQGSRFPTLGEDEWFPLVLEDEQGTIEITHAIAISGDAITVMRGQEGTEARIFAADTLVSLRLTPAASTSWFNGEDPNQEAEEDPDYGGTGLIFNGLIVNAYHTEQGRQGYFHPNSGTSEGQFVFAGACYLAADAIKDYADDNQPVPEGMTITGTLPDAKVGESYEGRLTINNSIGVCTVEQIAGDALPPGSRIRVDNYRKEVVIEWPGYAELPGDPLFNGDFERGDEGWIKGPGWSIEPTGNGNDGHGARVGVYRGSGEAVMESQDFTPCEPGMRFPVKVNVQQGASAAGNAGAGIGMRYYSAPNAGAKVGEQFGNQVWSGAKGRWHWSNLDAVVPPGANFMRAIIVGGRKKENKPLWVDDASWSIPTTVGIGISTSKEITIRVTDSSGQVATWSGTIKIGNSIVWDYTWSKYSGPFLIGVTWLESLQVFVGYTSVGVMQSPTGLAGSWVQVSALPAGANIEGPTSIATNGSRLVFAGNPMSYSDDGGQSWTPVSYSGAQSSVRAVVFDSKNNVFIALIVDKTYSYYSKSGIEFTRVTHGLVTGYLAYYAGGGYSISAIDVKSVSFISGATHGLSTIAVGPSSGFVNFFSATYHAKAGRWLISGTSLFSASNISGPWLSIPSPLTGNGPLTGASIYIPDVEMIVGGGENPSVFFTSMDGVNIVPHQQLSLGTEGIIGGFAYSPSLRRLIGVGSPGTAGGANGTIFVAQFTEQAGD